MERTQDVSDSPLQIAVKINALAQELADDVMARLMMFPQPSQKAIVLNAVVRKLVARLVAIEKTPDE